MLERGGFSFVALLVINPIAILLYQNTSFSPDTTSETLSKALINQKRVISSVAAPQKVDINELKIAKPSASNCVASHQENCPVSSIE